MRINPNKRKHKVNNYINLTPAEQRVAYPDFVTALRLDTFRHLTNLSLHFRSPLTVITGSNRTGKSSILLCLGCSHYNFMTRNCISGKYERTRWGDVMKFTACDKQNQDWEYHITYRERGVKERELPGRRKHTTRKWSGCAKKEGQIGHPGPHIVDSPNGRHVYLIDLERIIPGRHHPPTIYSRVKGAAPRKLNRLVITYLSYIFENRYTASELGGIGERQVYSYTAGTNYSSFNSASGEDVLTRMLIDVVEAKDNSLILIEEIEIGLHPEIQRRLIDVLFCECTRAKKQFIITTHSQTIISSVEPSSRILLRRKSDDSIEVKANISVNGALSAMDSLANPLLSIYVEDDISRALVQEGLSIVMQTRPELRKIIKIIPVGSADKTYNYFKTRQATYASDRLGRGCACILDGDMRNLVQNGALAYPPEDNLYFHYGNEAPERMLLREFLKQHPNNRLQYHVDDGNAHNLMQKIVDEGLAVTPDNAMRMCINDLKTSPDGDLYFREMSDFIIRVCDSYIS